jgi:hypothetical protein
MIDKLDLLLEQVREPEPFDETFVQSVMQEVRVTEMQPSRWSSLRRPTVTMIAAAALITGGAVAAVVGTNPVERDRAAEKPRAATSVTVTDAPVDIPKVSAPVVGAKDPAASVADLAPEGFTTKHTSYITDAATGLRLETETYTNTFELDREHRVTLTLENTGRHPISISAAKGCGLQVLGSQKGDPSASASGEPAEYSDDLAWVCAGSTADPRVAVANERYVLAPGERRVADSFIRLRSVGEWSLVGVCRCTYTQVRPTPVPKDDDPLSDLARRALPSPLLPEQPDGSNLATPAIRVYVD